MYHFKKITKNGNNRWFIIDEKDSVVLVSIKTYAPGGSLTPAKLRPSTKTVAELVAWAKANGYERWQ